VDPALPKTFSVTRVSPTIPELDFMHDWCKENMQDNANILEFGAGPTTWAIATAITPNRYICMEHWVPSITDVIDHLEDIEIIKTNWYAIPDDIKYDLVFVDSSAGYPPGDDGLHRHEACEFSSRLLADGGHIMIHDWRKRSGARSRVWLEANGFECVASFNGRTGVGVFKRCS